MVCLLSWNCRYKSDALVSEVFDTSTGAFVCEEDGVARDSMVMDVVLMLLFNVQGLQSMY
jgi:hypothetical protein